MAIGKITKGNGFYGVMKYLLDEQKNPKILGGCMVSESPDEIAREFRQIANLRPGVQKPVRHFSISFAPEDGYVDDVTKEAIAYRVIDALRHRNSQFIVVGHDRDQPGHDEVHNHDHMHIVTNAVTLEGKYVRDEFDRFKIQKILREVEKEFGLKQIQSSWEVKNEKGMSVERESEIAKLVATSLINKPSLATWLDRLSAKEIDVRFNLTTKNVVTGVSFIKDGEAHKGSSIGAKWSGYKGTKKPSTLDEGCLIVSEIVQILPKDIPLMKAANLKSQQHSVRLNEVDRAMFDRSAEMAEIALLNQGGRKKWSNGRVEIAKDDDRLKVRRVRPEKVMFEAKRVEGKWEPVGFPNIGKVDVQLLERVNGAEGMDFKAIVVGRRAGSERKASPKLPKPSVEQVEIEESENFTGVDDALGERVETTPKLKVQAAIDWAAEQANDTVVEFVGYLTQRGVETKLSLDANDEVVDISYKLDGVRFESGELTDASLSQLEAKRGLTLNGMREMGIDKFDAEMREVKADEERKLQDYIESGKRNIDEVRVLVEQDSLRMEALVLRNHDRILGKFYASSKSPAKGDVELPNELPSVPTVEAPTVRMMISFSDLNNYRDYLKSREYEESLAPGERDNLTRKANRTLNPLVNAWRSLGRAAVGDEKLPASHQFFRSFETELDLSEKDGAGIEMGREWASRQPKIEREIPGDRSFGR